MRSRLAIYVVGAALLMGAGFYIWPTPYREYRVGEAMLRVNRFTGATDVLRADGWQRTTARK